MADIIITQDPTKPGVNKLNGPTMVSGKLPLSGLDPTGAANGEVVTLVGGVWTHGTVSGSGDTASNLGAGSQVFKSKVAADFQFRSLVAGTNLSLTQNANDITINATSASSFTSAFTSANQVITAAGALTIAHGLGSMPTLIQARLKNTTAEFGYSIGDEYIIDAGALDNATGYGVVIVPDATNLNIRYGVQGGQTFSGLNKTTGTATVFTNANWAFIIKAWK